MKTKMGETINKQNEVLETSFIKIVENNPRYSKVEKLIATLEAIARCRSRINGELNFCDSFYGRDSDGSRIGNPNNHDKVCRYLAISDRLKKYYNNQLEKLNLNKF